MGKFSVIHTVPDVLARIVEHKKAELSERRKHLAEWERRAEARLRDRRDFHAALLSAEPAIIAEIKKASPSKGVLANDFRPAAIAAGYERGGAAALSVLTDERFFHGALADLESARSAVRIPALRKDFTIDACHVVEAAAYGADAILLIAAVLDEREMRDLRELAERFKMAALVEVHDDAELEPALASGARIVGVNNRNLRTFEVTLETSLNLAARMPADILMVSESGIRSRSDIETLRAAGFRAFLVGEHLMRSPDPAAALQALRA